MLAAAAQPPRILVEHLGLVELVEVVRLVRQVEIIRALLEQQTQEAVAERETTNQHMLRAAMAAQVLHQPFLVHQ